MNSVYITIVFVAFTVAAAIMSIRLGYGGINPITIHCFVWGSLVALYAVPALDLTPMTTQTWGLLFLSTGALVVGSLQAWMYQSGRAWRREKILATGGITPGRYDDEKLNRYFVVGLTAVVAYVALRMYLLIPLVREHGGWAAIATENGSDFRMGTLDSAVETSETNFSGGSAALGVIAYALYIMANLSLFWGPYVLQRGWRMLGATPLLIMGAFSIATVQRHAFVTAAVLSAFSYYYHARNAPSRASMNRNHRAHGWTWWVLAMPVALAVLYVPLKWRDPTMTPVAAINSVVQYFIAPLASLNAYAIENPRLREPHLWFGAQSFWSVASILYRFGVPIKLPPAWYPYIHFQAHGSTVVNVYTDLLYFVLDFGWVGAFVIPYFVGVAATILHFKVVIERRIYLIPAATVLMTQVFMAFFAFAVLRDLRNCVIIVLAPMISRTVLERRDERATRVFREVGIPA